MSFVNKKAYHDYEVLETFSAGMMLLGYEIKSIRAGLVNLKGNFVHIWHNEPYVSGIHISPYPYAHTKEIDPVRRRKLLLRKREIAKIESFLEQKGVTAIVLEIYFERGLLKAKVGICRGKKLHDKREVQKKRDQQRQIDQAVKMFSR